MSDRPYGLRILSRPAAPLLNEQGKTKLPTPYLPVANQCNVCPGPCCRRHVVHVTLPDVVVLTSAMSVPFVHAFRFVVFDDEMSFRLESADDVDVSTGAFDGSASLALRRTSAGSCVMLLDLGGFGRCGAHSVRPSNCRMYPLSWESDVAKGGPHAIDCVRPYGITPKMADSFYRDAERMLDHRAIHQQVIENWHARDEVGSARDFLNFALPATAEALGVTLDLERTLDERPADDWLLDLHGSP